MESSVPSCETNLNTLPVAFVQQQTVKTQTGIQQFM